MLPIDEPALTADLIRSRHDALLARLRAAADAAGRDPDDGSGGGGHQGIRDRGHSRGDRAPDWRRFGENRVQEAIPKMAAAPDAEWHLVGRLQGNKARPAVRGFAAIHSVDSLELLGRLDRIAAGRSLVPRWRSSRST